jgi:nitroreductase
MHKPAITDTAIDDLLATRWSPRAYDVTKTVTQQQILSLLEAARWAPSCFGDQPWRYVVCDKTSNPQAWQHA